MISVELLSFGHLAMSSWRLQGFQIEADGGNGRLEFVGDGIEEKLS